jgi:hypothetical protein
MSLGGRPVALHPELAKPLKPVKPMGWNRRVEGYMRQAGVPYGYSDEVILTDAQGRRARHKMHRDMATRAGERTRGPAFTPASGDQPVQQPAPFQVAGFRTPDGSLIDTYAELARADEKLRGQVKTKAVKTGLKIRRGASRAR